VALSSCHSHAKPLPRTPSVLLRGVPALPPEPGLIFPLFFFLQGSFLIFFIATLAFFPLWRRPTPPNRPCSFLAFSLFFQCLPYFPLRLPTPLQIVNFMRLRSKRKRRCPRYQHGYLILAISPHSPFGHPPPKCSGSFTVISDPTHGPISRLSTRARVLGSLTGPSQ